MNYSGIIDCTVADGLGFRTSLYISGCVHKCEGCHNPQTWDFNYGKPYTDEVEQFLFDCVDQPFIKGLTLSGGDPIFSIKEVIPLLERFRERFGDTKNVWLYTGYTLDALKALKEPLISRLFDLVDVIVDGPFILAQRDISLPFRGSKNQRVMEKDENGEFKEKKFSKKF